MTVRTLYALLLIALPVAAQQAPAGTEIARVIQIAGDVQAVDAAGTVRRLIRGDFVHAGETLRTSADGRA